MTTDLNIFENGSGGELSIINDNIPLVETLYQTIYIALFGGNIEASTAGDEIDGQERLDWWGNSLLYPNIEPKQFNSETERALNNNALNTSGRLIIESAVVSDLEYLREITNFTVNVTISSVNTVNISIVLIGLPNEPAQSVNFVWNNARNELIINKNIGEEI